MWHLSTFAHVCTLFYGLYRMGSGHTTNFSTFLPGDSWINRDGSSPTHRQGAIVIWTYISISGTASRRVCLALRMVPNIVALFSSMKRLESSDLSSHYIYLSPAGFYLSFPRQSWSRCVLFSWWVRKKFLKRACEEIGKHRQPFRLSPELWQWRSDRSKNDTGWVSLLTNHRTNNNETEDLHSCALYGLKAGWGVSEYH
jgi:hypothetical protein